MNTEAKLDVITRLLAGGASNIDELLKAQAALKMGSPIAERRFQRAILNAMSEVHSGADLTMSQTQRDEILSRFITEGAGRI